MKTFAMSLALAALGLFAQVAQAGEGCCDCCGCACDRPAKKCVLRQEMKKITVTCYGCECEDFCVPGPSCRGCSHEAPCDDCCQGCQDGCKCDHSPACKVKWTDWCPSCADVRTRKKLVKYEMTKEVPVWKWVVVDACAECASKKDAAPAGAKEGAPAPVPAPAPKATSNADLDVVPTSYADEDVAPRKKTSLWSLFSK